MTIRQCCNLEALNKQTPRKNTTGDTSHPQQFLHFVKQGGDIKTTISFLTHSPDLQWGCALHRGVTERIPHLLLRLKLPMAVSFPGKISEGPFGDRQQLYLWAAAYVFFLCFPVIADDWMEWWQTSVADISTLINSYWNNLDEEISF